MFNFVTPSQVIVFANGHVQVSLNSVEFLGEMKYNEHQLRIRIRSTDDPKVPCYARLEIKNIIMGDWNLLDQILPIKMQTKAGTSRFPKGFTWEENFEADIDTLYKAAIRNLQD